MTDRELLELAAKAAGLKYINDHASYSLTLRETPEWMEGHRTDWSPLYNDIDAFRLAVKLRLDITVHKNQSLYTIGELCASTRRAIVSAAAEIGRDMP